MGADKVQLDLGETIRKLYGIVANLEMEYSDRHFTLDGHLVGSIGEVYVRERYGVHLYEASHEIHDGYWPDSEDCTGRIHVQIKTTQRGSIAISDCPEHLIVLKLNSDGEFDEIYNGPGDTVWNEIDVDHRKRPKNGQYQISLSKLRRLAASASANSRIPEVR